MQSETQQKCILTTRGPIPMPEDLSNCFAFAHQYLHPEVCNTSSKPLTLETLPYHIQKPMNVENTSITATLLQHQLLSVKSMRQNIPDSNYYLINASASAKNKTPDQLAKYNIIKGFVYKLPQGLKNSQGTITKEIQAMSSPEHIMKEIQYEFALSSQQSGFIGEISLPEELGLMNEYKNYSAAFKVVFEKYQLYSEKNQCPIMVGLLDRDQNGYIYQSQQNIQKNKEKFEQIVDFFLKVLQTNKNAVKNIILVNPKFVIESTISIENSSNPFTYTNLSLPVIESLYQRDFNICFDLLRYSRDKNSLIWIASLLHKYPKQTILSGGIKFKTDLQQFGGQGLILQKTLPFIGSCLGEEAWKLLNTALTENILGLLCWYIKKIVIQEVRMWTCVKCGKQSPETEEAFRKFGKDFCSISCLKGFKF